MKYFLPLLVTTLLLSCSLQKNLKERIEEFQNLNEAIKKSETCKKYLTGDPQGLHEIVKDFSQEELQRIKSNEKITIQLAPLNLIEQPPHHSIPVLGWNYLKPALKIKMSYPEFIENSCISNLNTIVRFGLSYANTFGVNSKWGGQGLDLAISNQEFLSRYSTDPRWYIAFSAYQFQSTQTTRILDWWIVSLKTHKALMNNPNKDISTASAIEAAKAARILAQYQDSIEYQQLLNEKTRNLLR